MKKTFKLSFSKNIILWLIFFSFCSWTVKAIAQDVSFEATVNTNKVSLGSTIQLSLTINGTQNASSPIELPAIDGFEARYLGPSTRISIVNGQYHSTISYLYTLFPLKLGHFQIPAVNVTLEGKAFSSQPIDLDVVDDGQASGSVSNENQVAGSTAGLQDKIFVTMNTPKKEVYANEKVPLSIKLFVSTLSVRDLEFPVFDHDGFSVDNFGQPNQYQQVVGGVQYNVVEFTTNVYPTRTGELILGPARSKCNLLYESSRGRQLPGAGAGNGSLFDDDFFNGFFQNYEKRPMTLESTDLHLTVLPLPAEGKTPDFSGAIGQFDFEVSVSPSEVAVGDPVTLKMKLTGSGNFKSLNFPSLENTDAFKFYDPQIKDENNTKSLEQVVIPKSENVKEIPVVSFTFFNPDTQSYQTIPRGPFPLKVKKGEQKEDFKVVGLSGGATPNALPETIGHDIIFIKDHIGSFQKSGLTLNGNPVFMALIIFYVFLWSILFYFYQHSRKIKSDIVYARNLQAPRKARKGLEAARGFLEKNQRNEFYDAIFRTLREYLGDKFHLSTGGLTFSAIEQVLKARNIKQETMESIKTVFDDCDIVRYAAAGQNKEKMEENFRKVQMIIDSLERQRS